MTAEGHVAEAERHLTDAAVNRHSWDAQTALASALLAIGHALVALAIETGAPHPAAAGGGSSGG